MLCISNLCISTTVIGEPDDVTVCERKVTTFTCVLNGNLGDGIQWYKFIMDTGTTEMVEPDDDRSITISTHTGYTTNISLTITNALKSYTGYYWVRLPSDDNVCNVSLTVLTSKYNIASHVYVCMWIEFYIPA